MGSSFHLSRSSLDAPKEAKIAATVWQELFLPKSLLERVPPYLMWTWGCQDCAAYPLIIAGSLTEGLARRSACRHNRLFHGRDSA